MLAPFLLAFTAITADPTPEQVKLLTTFREEFVPITPGEGDFAAGCTIGRTAAPRAKARRTK